MNRLVAGLVALTLLVSGCGKRSVTPEPNGESRVICASPAVAEIVFALGCGDRVVGVSAFTDWPPEAAEKPQIGGPLAPSYERIVMLEPTLVLSQGRAEKLGAWCKENQISFKTVPLDTLEDLRQAVSTYAEALNAEEQGARLLDRINHLLETSATGEAVPVFLAIGHAPDDLSALMTSGPGTFLDGLAAAAGGSNIFADVAVDWPAISQESLIRRKPWLVLDFQSLPMDEPRRIALLDDWSQLGFTPDQVRFLDADVFLRPGPRAVESIPVLGEAIQIRDTKPSSGLPAI